MRRVVHFAGEATSVGRTKSASGAPPDCVRPTTLRSVPRNQRRGAPVPLHGCFGRLPERFSGLMAPRRLAWRQGRLLQSRRFGWRVTTHADVRSAPHAVIRPDWTTSRKQTFERGYRAAWGSRLRLQQSERSALCGRAKARTLRGGLRSVSDLTKPVRGAVLDPKIRL